MNTVNESITESTEKVKSHFSKNWKKIIGVTILAAIVYIMFNIFYLKQPVGAIESSFTNKNKNVSFQEPLVSESLPVETTTAAPTTSAPTAFNTTPPPYALETDFEDYVRKHEEKHKNQSINRSIFG